MTTERSTRQRGSFPPPKRWWGQEETKKPFVLADIEVFMIASVLHNLPKADALALGIKVTAHERKALEELLVKFEFLGRSADMKVAAQSLIERLPYLLDKDNRGELGSQNPFPDCETILPVLGKIKPRKYKVFIEILKNKFGVNG